MVGCRLCCLICFFACSSVLPLVASLNDVEASSCQRVIHKKVGDTVELSSCLSADGVIAAEWKYGNLIIADKDGTSPDHHQFKDRFYLNPTNFSLTLRKLTLQDSGDFSFLSEDKNGQRETIIITLQVHETITQKPVLTSNSTWYNLNESCVVLLECSAAIPNISYNWTVGNQTKSGSRLQYSIRPQDGKINFTCIIYNFVSKMSASVMVECSNETETIKTDPKSFPLVALWIVGPVCGVFLIILLLLFLCYCTRSKDSCFCESMKCPEAVGNDETSCVTYCFVELKEIAKKGKTIEPEEGAVYSNMRKESAADTTLMYVQVCSYNEVHIGKLFPHV